jgi:hypothetical protein
VVLRMAPGMEWIDKGLWGERLSYRTALGREIDSPSYHMDGSGHKIRKVVFRPFFVPLWLPLTR